MDLDSRVREVELRCDHVCHHPECEMDAEAWRAVAIVLASLFGHVGGEKRAASILALTVLRQWRLPDRVLEVMFDGGGRSVW